MQQSCKPRSGNPSLCRSSSCVLPTHPRLRSHTLLCQRRSRTLAPLFVCSRQDQPKYGTLYPTSQPAVTPEEYRFTLAPFKPVFYLCLCILGAAIYKVVTKAQSKPTSTEEPTSTPDQQRYVWGTSPGASGRSLQTSTISPDLPAGVTDDVIDVQARISPAASGGGAELSATDNIGRLVICAQLPQQQQDEKRLQSQYNEAVASFSQSLPTAELPAGFLLVYSRCALYVLEGDNNLLLALARWLAPELHYGAALGPAGASAAATAAAVAGQPAAGMSVDELLARNAMAMAGMDPLQGRAQADSAAAGGPRQALAGLTGQQARVVSFVSDVRTRLFSGHQVLFHVEARDVRQGRALEEAEIVKAASEVDDFNRATAVRLNLLPAGAAIMSSGQQKALLLAAPSPNTIMSLAVTTLLPSLPDFLEQYDLDYRRYKELKEAVQLTGQAGPAAAELQQLAALYEGALQRELALQQQQQLQARLQQARKASPLARYYKQ